MRKKSYAIEECMSGLWFERWALFPSEKSARAFARLMKKKYIYSRFRIVRVIRQQLKVL
jgi:hypothetical protein